MIQRHQPWSLIECWTAWLASQPPTSEQCVRRPDGASRAYWHIEYCQSWLAEQSLHSPYREWDAAAWAMELQITDCRVQAERLGTGQDRGLSIVGIIH